MRGARRGRRARVGPCHLRSSSLERAAPTRDRARSSRNRGHPGAGAPARDPRSDPPARRRGPADLQPRRRHEDAPRRHPPPDRPRRDARADRTRGAAAALYRGDLATTIVAPSRTVAVASRSRISLRIALRGGARCARASAATRSCRTRRRRRAASWSPTGLRCWSVSRGGPGSAEAIASLAEVMREQTRVRDDSFTRALHRGGLARRLLSEEGIAAGVARIEASAPGVPEPAPAGTTHVSAVDSNGNAASLSSSTGSGSGVIVPGHRHPPEQHARRVRPRRGRSRHARQAADEHDGADDRGRRRRAAARRR